MIKFAAVSKTYPGGTQALRDINFHIKPGEFVSIVGQSGAGKTTLIKLLIAEEKPTNGKIIVGDWDISKIKSHEVPYLRRQIGVVFQDFKLLQEKTIYENVAFGLEVIGASGKFIKNVVPQVLKLVGLEQKRTRFPNELSIGEVQRVAIARVLAKDPPVILADEPTGNLDSRTGKEIMNILTSLHEEKGITLVMITHDISVASQCQRIIRIKDGLIVTEEEKSKVNEEKYEKVL